MTHTIEPASSGRAKCRGCGLAITKGELRFGERLPNPFADDGDMTIWFHLLCAAYKRPEPLAEIINDVNLDNKDSLQQIMESGLAHRRLPRVNGIQRASSGRARCRCCRETIVRDDWRIPLVFFEDGMFNASGYVHLGCVIEYFETSQILDRVLHFIPEELSADDLDELSGAIS